MQEKKKSNRKKWRLGTQAFEVAWIGEKESCNPIEGCPQLLDISELVLQKLYINSEMEQLFLDYTWKNTSFGRIIDHLPLKLLISGLSNNNDFIVFQYCNTI